MNIWMVMRSLPKLKFMIPQVRHLVVDQEIKLLVQGTDGETTFSFGPSSTHTSITWQVDNSEIVSLIEDNTPPTEPDDPTSEHSRLDDAHSIWVRAKSPGSVTVHAIVSSAPSGYSVRTFRASLQISVLPEFSLLTPSDVLLPPGGQLQIRTTRDQMEVINYRMDCASSSGLH